MREARRPRPPAPGRALLSATLLVALVVASSLMAASRPAPEAPPTRAAAAGSSYFCSGYQGCRDAGYSDAGYGAVSGRMYWRMYSGHNCTNYAAYRMIKAGMSSERPWSGSGMAYNWGHAMRDITDQNPSVGAIAWWDRYHGGIGSSGHVAYVERVVSRNEIIISEDSWSGTFHWRRVTRSSGSWPSGFIHFVDKTLEMRTEPAVKGTPRVGNTVRASTGRWKPSADAFDFQWFANGKAISGATDRAYTPTPGQRSKKLTVEVTARKASYNPATTTTDPTAPIELGRFVTETPATISGDPIVDERLTLTPATWSPAPRTTVYRWYADGEVIPGENGTTLTLTRGLVGSTITAISGARRAGYWNAPSRTRAVGPVVVGEIGIDTPWAVSGEPRVGERLRAEPGTTTPADAEPSYQWLRDGDPIDGATGTSYLLTGEDLGSSVSLQVTLQRRNHMERTDEVAGPGVVTTAAAVAVTATGRSGGAVVVVRVSAPGVDPVTGSVEVKVGGAARTVRLVDGRVREVFTNLPAGQRTVRVRYDGTTHVAGAFATTTVRVTR